LNNYSYLFILNQAALIKAAEKDKRCGISSDTLHSLLSRLFRLIITVAALTLFAGAAMALELPAPDILERRYGLSRQTISVIEPHMSNADRPVVIRYVGLPMDALLTHWFGDNWKAPDAEVVFLANDGYRSVIPSSSFKKFHAFLAFGRDDGAAFVLDIPEQNQKHIPLDPYYLVWDNRGGTELLRQGASGWPYQVTRIEFHNKVDDRALLPLNPTKDEAKGLTAAKAYCLTCHHIRGRGGKKYAEDLALASCRWTDADLKAWIDDPSQVRPGTAMPPLSKMLPAEERRQVAERIFLYLRAMNKGGYTACVKGGEQP
jgi:cytochrome c2